MPNQIMNRMQVSQGMFQIQTLIEIGKELELVTAQKSIVCPLLNILGPSQPLLSRNEPVQPHGSLQCPDLSGTTGSPSCFTNEPPTANEPECCPSSKDETKQRLVLHSRIIPTAIFLITV